MRTTFAFLCARIAVDRAFFLQRGCACEARVSKVAFLISQAHVEIALCPCGACAALGAAPQELSPSS